MIFIVEAPGQMKPIIKYICRIACGVAGLGAIALAFEEGFSWFTVLGILAVLMVISDIVIKTDISKYVGGFILLPFLIVAWFVQGVCRVLWNLFFGRRKKHEFKPFSLEEMMFYDWIFGEWDD